MSDAHLRELERAWLQGGTVADEARWLAARLQGGAVTRKGLELAAWLGHQAAALTADDPLCPATRLPLQLRFGRTGPAVHADFSQWTEGFVRFGRAAERRAVVALLARHVERLAGSPWARAARACLAAAVRFTLEPGAQEARRRLLEVVACATPRHPFQEPGPRAPLELAYGLAVDALGRVPPRLARLPELRSRWSSWDGDGAAGREELEELRGLLAARLVPWALGLHDPATADLPAELDAGAAWTVGPRRWRSVEELERDVLRHSQAYAPGALADA